jgi:hypothetical protein
MRRRKMKDTRTIMTDRRPQVKVSERALTSARVDVQSIVLLSSIVVLVVLLITGLT